MSRLPEPRSTLVLAVALFTVLTLAGCGGSRRAYPASGKVLDGEQNPAAGATVILHPLDNTDSNAPKPTGVVNEAGNFTLSTYGNNDGAPVGEYAMTVIWIPTRKLTSDPEGTDRLEGRYDHPERSPLPKVRIVKPGPNELPAVVVR